MATLDLPPIETLRKLIRLDWETGKIYWKYRPPSMFEHSRRLSPAGRAAAWNAHWAGREIGCKLRTGYMHCTVQYSRAPVHVVVFALAFGRFPKGQLDHINGVRDDNRPSNLRDVSAFENQKNRGISTRNQTGVVGVCRSGRQWMAYATDQRGNRWMQRFDCLGVAIKARRQREKDWGYHDNHGTKRQRY